MMPTAELLKIFEALQKKCCIELGLKMPSLKKTIKFNPLDASGTASKPSEAPKRKPTKQTEAPTPKQAKQTEAKAPKPKQTKQASPPLNAQTAADQYLKTIDYVIQVDGERGSSPLLANGSDFGFDVPSLGFITLKSREMKSQLKDHFLMPRVIGGFFLGGSLGYAVSFILGKPKNKHYFFLVKSSHGKLVFARFDSPTLAYVINKIYN
jgi:hypothetical protein